MNMNRAAEKLDERILNATGVVEGEVAVEWGCFEVERRIDSSSSGHTHAAAALLLLLCCC
jgi:hypothetical protein